MGRVCSSVLQPVARLSSVVRSCGLVAAGAAALCLMLPGAAVGQDCPNAAIRAQQGPAVEALPDCMALELVSPARKFSQDAYPDSVSADGSRATYVTLGDAVNDPPVQAGLFGDVYVGSRGGSGWVGEAMLPSPGKAGVIVSGWSGGYFGRSLSADFSRWVALGSTASQLDVGAGTVWRGGVGDAFLPLSPLLAPLGGSRSYVNMNATRFFAASADHGRVVFRAGDLDATFLPGDPVPAGSGADRNAYVVGRDGGVPSVWLLARDGSGTVWGGRCGARLPRNQGAVSLDGSRIFFTTRPSQAGSGECDVVANPLRIMRRVETPGGPEVSELVSSECDRVAPVCSTANGDDVYQGASVDGTKVYFTTTRQLADSDLDVGFSGLGCSTFFGSPGCDLYMYDSERPDGDRLVQVSAGTTGSGAGVLDGVAAISADGSHVYFVAQGVLTNEPNSRGQTAAAFQSNFYSFVYDDEHPDGQIKFIGAAAAFQDGGFLGGLWGSRGTFLDDAYPVPASSVPAGQVDPVGGDGRVLVFNSAAPMTADDTDGGAIDVFRYDSDSGELTRLSRAAPGGSDNGFFSVGDRGQLAANAERVGTDYAEFNRVVSEDADTVLFRTAEQLVAEDTDTDVETYMSRDGEIYRLPQTAGVVTVNVVSPMALSHDGSVVSFGSREQLLPQDGDTAIDTYVARVDGGFEISDPPIACEVMAGGCQGGGSGSLDGDRRTSFGGGNAEPGARKMLAVGLPARQARRRAARTGRLALSVRLNEPGIVKVVGRARVGKRIVRVGGASARLDGAGRARAVVRLSARAKRVLRGGRSLRVVLRVTSSGARSRTIGVLLPGVQS